MKANYFKFGLFLVVAAALIVTAVVILGAGAFEPEGVYFETYFDRSVGGLNVGAPVELQGVEIGQVESIGFASEIYKIPDDLTLKLGEARLVRVVFSVDRRFARALSADERESRRDRELHSGLRVRLESNLITGQAYLQGTYVDPNRFPVSELAWKSEFPYMPSVPSELATLKDSVDRVLVKLEQLDVERLLNHIDDLVVTTDKAVEDANIGMLREQANGLLMDARSKVQAIDAEKIGRQVEGLVANADGAVTDVRGKIDGVHTEQISARIENTLAVLDRTIVDANVAALAQEVRSLFVETRATNKRLQELLARPDSDKELANVAMLIDEMNTTMRRVNFLIATQGPRIEGTLENFRKISTDVRDLSEGLKRSPSDLILSSPPRESELLK
ncbi:MAG: MlaD family protein [Solirubrobacterales bacterium]